MHGGKQDAYQRVYHNHTMCAVHCEMCKYQTLPRFGDLTIGDFWGLGKKDLEIDVSNGVSAILCNNEKGKKFLECISPKDIKVMKEVPLNWLGGNGYTGDSNHNYASPKRDSFYQAIKTMPFSEAADYALKPNHGNYNKIYQKTNSPLQYNTSFLQFQFDETVWEEYYIKGSLVLMVKEGMSRVGKYAKLPLYKPLEKGKRYICDIRFKIKTDAKILNFHVKDSGSNYYQVIKSCNISKENDGEIWKEISFEFVVDSDIYDEFMIGASQIKGKDNFIAFNYINISEK